MVGARRSVGPVPASKTAGSGNRLLGLLPRPEREALRPSLHTVQLARRERLAVPGQPMQRAFFLTRGLVSILGQAGRSAPIEVGVVGSEGFVGLPIVLADGVAPLEVVVQIPGSALAIAADRLREALPAAPVLRASLLRYAQVSAVQAAATIVANGRARVSERLARWLLISHDRDEGDVLELTHDFLALMVGARRAGVTNALRDFERRGLISKDRGRLTIRDRSALLEAAGGFYGAEEREFERLFPAAQP